MSKAVVQGGAPSEAGRASAVLVPGERARGERMASGPRWDLETLGGIRKLEAYLDRRLDRQVRDFRLLMQKKGVILRGRAGSYYVKQLAQHAFMETTHLAIFANEIEVTSHVPRS